MSPGLGQEEQLRELISAGVLPDLLNILAPWAEGLNWDQVLVPVQVYLCFNHGCSAAV